MKLRKDFINKNYEDAYDVKEFDFSHADLRNVNFTRANLEGATFKGSNLKGAVFEDAILTDAVFDGANLEGANLIGVEMRVSEFSRVNFNGANFKDADFTFAMFYYGKLEGAILDGATFNHASLVDANLNNAVMTRTQLEGAFLSGAKLKQANLTKAYLVETDFTNANLTDANFTNANLTDANFVDANLTNVNFTNAILTNANFTNADTTNAVFDGSNIHDAIFHHRTTYKIINWLTSDVEPMTTIKLVNTFDETTVHDFINGDIPKIEVQDDNVIFYIQHQSQGFAIPRNSLLQSYDDRSAIFVSCNQIIPSGGVNIESVIPYHLFFRINLTMPLFVPIDSMKALLISNHKEWYIKETGNIIDYSASLQVVYDNDYEINIFGEEVLLSSKDHCQSGTKQRLYNLTPIEFEPSRKIRRIGGKKNKCTEKKRHTKCRSSKKRTIKH